jgi:hypothetical protein
LSTISAYQNGSTAHTPNGGVSMHERAKRSTVKGWTKETVRRHTKWLYAVNTEGLTGDGYAVTLTLRDCPESSERFHELRRSWVKRVERMGTVRIHWVIEWQRRGVPHMHTALYFNRPLSAVEKFQLVQHWIDVAQPYGAKHISQYLLSISGPTGWLQYLSKHAARGAAHYQRQGKPSGWEKTGRLWGHLGSWPVEEPMHFHVPQEAFFRYRRLVRAWRLADARSEEDSTTRARRVKSARGMLKCRDRKLSEVRGISEWIDQPTLLGFLALLSAEGYQIQQIAD